MLITHNNYLRLSFIPTTWRVLTVIYINITHSKIVCHCGITQHEFIYFFFRFYFAECIGKAKLYLWFSNYYFYIFSLFISFNKAWSLLLLIDLVVEILDVYKFLDFNIVVICIECRTFRPRTFGTRTFLFNHGHFGLGRFGHGHFGLVNYWVF